MACERSATAGGRLTVIEVLCVMIIAILVAIAIPMYVGQRDRAKDAGARIGGRLAATAVL